MSYTSDTRVVKAARKAHVCDWCSEAIEVGTSYATWTSVWDGRWGVTKVHPECRRGMASVPSGDLQDGWLPGDYERGTGHEKGGQLRAVVPRGVRGGAGASGVVNGAVMAIAASLLGSAKEGQPDSSFTSLASALNAHPGVVCSMLAVVSAGFGWQLLDRAASATRAASCATMAIMRGTHPGVANADADHAAYVACVGAKAMWLEGRMSVDRLEGIISGLAGRTNGRAQHGHNGVVQHRGDDPAKNDAENDPAKNEVPPNSPLKKGPSDHRNDPDSAQCSRQPSRA